MREPHNRARGEVMLEIDGAPRRICVTLGALAELEAAFDVVSLAELGERLAQLTASDLIIVLSALSGVSSADLTRAEIEPKAAATAVAEAFRLASTTEATPWAAMLRLSATFGVSPTAFWRLGLREWRALTQVRADGALSRAAFDALAARFPDEART